MADGPQLEELASTARFRRNRLLANGLLGGMAAVFVVTHLAPEPGFLILLARAGSEAGVVGGIADWFAVTAVFRRPLGLPIPHTAIIPNSKDRIGESLGGFIERHFLTGEAVLAKLRQLKVGERFARWLSRPESGLILTDAVDKSLPYIIRFLDSQDLRDFAGRTLGEQFRQADIAPILARVLRAAATGGEADTLFDHGIELADRLLRENRTQIEAMVQQRSSWWVPRAVDRRISAALITGLFDLVEKLRQPDSEARVRFREVINDYVTALESSPEQAEKVNAAKNRLLEHHDVKAWLGSVWGDLSGLALADLDRTPSAIRGAVDKAIGLLSQALSVDQAMQANIDRLLERLALYLVGWSGEVGSFFTDVVKNWDAKTLTARLESVVGSDLQYIRMNGTVVGALVGCLLFLLMELVF